MATKTFISYTHDSLAIADYKTVLGLVTDDQWHDEARQRLRALGVRT